MSFSSWRPRSTVLGLCLALVGPAGLHAGCASGEVEARDTGGGGGGSDAGRLDGGGNGSDAGRLDGGRVDGGGGGTSDTGVRRDAGSTSCPSGQHACGAGCVADLANEPANGCRLGCGEACDAPAMGVAACAMDGTCTWTCEVPFRREGERCVCTPTTCDTIGYECGAPDDGCGMPLDCGACMDGAMCATGRCACTPDGREPNDSNTMPSVGPRLNDADDPPDQILSGVNLDEMRDEDWFSHPITDGTDGGNPRITVTLRNIPIGSDYELSAYYVCGDRTDNSTCAAGSPDNYVGRGCAGGATGASPETVELETDCSRGLDSDDTGTLLVRVRAATWATTCAPYEVVVRVR
jgi:hypothetical protein